MQQKLLLFAGCNVECLIQLHLSHLRLSLLPERVSTIYFNSLCSQTGRQGTKTNPQTHF